MLCQATLYGFNLKRSGLHKVRRYRGYQHRHPISLLRTIEVEAAVWKLLPGGGGRTVKITLPFISCQAKMFKGGNRTISL